MIAFISHIAHQATFRDIIEHFHKSAVRSEFNDLSCGPVGYQNMTVMCINTMGGLELARSRSFTSPGQFAPGPGTISLFDRQDEVSLGIAVRCVNFAIQIGYVSDSEITFFRGKEIIGRYKIKLT